MHVTIKVRVGQRSLRSPAAMAIFLRALEGSRTEAFRVTHFSVQIDHIHMLVETDHRDAFSSGLRSLNCRLARNLNKLWQRRGRLFAGRHHEQVLKTPRQVRYAIRYVLQNGRKHRTVSPTELDPCSSASQFDGWRGYPAEMLHTLRRKMADLRLPRITDLFAPRTWLLAIGWREWGLLPATESPAT